MDSIRIELVKARAKHLLFAGNERHAMNIIGEEYGEAVKAVNDGDIEAARIEVAQLAATCIRFLEEL